MTTSDDKRRFLVVNDYGQGGVWVLVWARSAAEIETRFRDLKVIEKKPSWLTDDELARIEAKMTFDVDAIQPDDWIAKFVRSK